MVKITKAELIQFIKENHYAPLFTERLVDWRWREGSGSQSSKNLNKKIRDVISEDRE